MKSLAIWVDPVYQTDRLFEEDSILNRDDCLRCFRSLRYKLEEAQWRCHTQDIYFKEGTEDFDILFLDIPNNLKEIKQSYPSSKFYLLIQECEVIKPHNWVLEDHRDFDHIFTWSPTLVKKHDNYHLVNFSQQLDQLESEKHSGISKLCTMICGNKYSQHPKELYSLRREIIDWFQKHSPESFDFYGVGWDCFKTRNRLINKVLEFSGLGRLISIQKYKSYRGPSESKFKTYSDYRFIISYENAIDIPGYVTEKIFDVMVSGSVPVYLGAPDIYDYVDPSCFVDARKFSSIEEIVNHLKSMDEVQYQEYKENIRRYLASDLALPYTDRYFSETISRVVTGHA